MEQLEDLINRLFQKQSAALMVGLIGVAAAFVVIMLCGTLVGDFVKAKRALRLVATGRLEEGRRRLWATVPRAENGLCYDSAVTHPYRYSLTKKMPVLMLVSTGFFVGLSLFASLNISGIFTGFTVAAFLVPALLGFAFYALLVATNSSMLKAATLYFYKAAEMIGNIPITEEPRNVGGSNGYQSQYKTNEYQSQYQAGGHQASQAGNCQDNENELSAEIVSLCARIEEVALEGGADHRTLSGLYGEIKELQQKANTPAAEAKLAAALEVLIVLVDSAL